MKRASSTLALVATAAIAVVWIRLFATTTDAWATPVHWVATITMTAFALATLIVGTRRAGAGVAIAIALKTVQLAVIALSLAGIEITRVPLFPHRGLAIVVGAMCVLAIYGLARRRLWARWLGLAFGSVGVVSGGLNAYNYWHVTAQLDPTFTDWSLQMFETAWVLWITTIGGALIVANLLSPAARAAFTSRAADSTWSSRDRLIGLLRATIIAAFAAVPMLFVYAWLQPIAAQTKETALVLAAALALGAALAVRGKLAGALVLVAAGLGLLAQTALTALDAAPADRMIAAYYAVFWLPAGALALACGARMAGPTWRLLCRGSR